MSISCPQCHTETVLEGKIYNQVDYVNPPAYFRPNGLPFYAVLGTNIAMKNSFFACLFCGFLWTKIDISGLQQMKGRRNLLDL